jgi:uncharacterized protein YgiM (DUF1202 family)
MKAILQDEITRVVQEPTSESLSITSLRKGDEVEVGKVIRKGKEVWVTVTLANGATGYIAGNTTIFQVKKVESAANDLEVHESPAEDSAVVTTIPKRTAFIVRGFEKVEGDEWYQAEDAQGVRGYIKTGPKLRIVPEVTRSSARRMMITGGVFALGGVILYVIGLYQKPTTGGDANFITIGLILLGLFQVFQGYMQHRQAKRNDEKNPK